VLCWAGACLLACVGASSAAVAAPADAVTARLVYSPGKHAAACPSREDVEDAVSARLGYVPWVADAPTGVVMQIQDGEPGLQAAVAFVDAAGVTTGRRAFRSPAGDCRELVATATLSISVTLDPMVMLRPASAPPPAPPQPPPPPPPPLLVAPAVTQAAPPAPSKNPLWDLARRWLSPRLGVGARALGNLGSQPAPTVGMGMDAFAGLGPLVGMLDARVLLPTGGRGSGGAFYLGHAWLTAGACLDRWVVAACPTVSLAGVAAQGLGDWVIGNRFTWTAAVGVRGQARIPLWGPLHAVLTGDANVALRRVRFRRVADDVTLWTAPPVFAELGLGLAWVTP
jgi:hypothetical protein